MGPALTIADRAYAPKPGAPARPAMGSLPAAGWRKKNTGEALLTQNRKHYRAMSSLQHELFFDPYRADPRSQALLQRMDLV